MIADPNPCPEPPGAEKRPVVLTCVLWTVQLAAAGILFYVGTLKLTDNPGDVKLFEKIDMEPFGRYVIGSLECAAGILMLIRQSSIYGAFLGLGVMCGAIIGHLTVLGLEKIQYAIFVALLCLTILYLRRRDAPFIRNLLDR